MIKGRKKINTIDQMLLKLFKATIFNNLKGPDISIEWGRSGKRNYTFKISINV